MNFSRYLLCIVTFLCFFPYPSAPVGNYTGLQMIFFVCPFIVLFTTFQRPTFRSLVVFILIMVPYLLAGTIALIRGTTIISTNTYKAAPAYILCLLPMLAIAPFVDRKNRAALLSTIAAATVIHGAFGLFQWVAFKQGIFPFKEWFNNNSFMLAENDLLGRPMGYFPEPSAMAAVLGPFLMLMIAFLADRRKKPMLSTGERQFMFIAVALGLALLALSKSGFILPFAVSLVAVTLLGLPALGGRGLMHKIVLYCVFVVVVCVISIWTWTLVQDRFETEFTLAGSWSGRLDSIVQSMEILSAEGSARLWFGVGSNQAHLHMEQTGTYQTFGGMTRFGAVYSVLFTYILETGLLGALAFMGVIVISVRSILRSDFAMGGMAVLFCWFSAITATTSYFVLPGLWLCLGLLVIWDRLFPIGDTEAVQSSVARNIGQERHRQKLPSFGESKA
jgi:hypothetical protein